MNRTYLLIYDIKFPHLQTSICSTNKCSAIQSWNIRIMLFYANWTTLGMGMKFSNFCRNWRWLLPWMAALLEIILKDTTRRKSNFDTKRVFKWISYNLVSIVDILYDQASWVSKINYWTVKHNLKITSNIASNAAIEMICTCNCSHVWYDWPQSKLCLFSMIVWIYSVDNLFNYLSIRLSHSLLGNWNRKSDCLIIRLDRTCSIESDKPRQIIR